MGVGAGAGAGVGASLVTHNVLPCYNVVAQ